MPYKLSREIATVPLRYSKAVHTSSTVPVPVTGTGTGAGAGPCIPVTGAGAVPVSVYRTVRGIALYRADALYRAISRD